MLRLRSPKLRFLLSRKYPDWEEIRDEYEQASLREKRTLERKIAKIEVYLMGLQALPKDILELFYEEELKKVEVIERRSVEEHERYLNCEDADARLAVGYWVQLDGWTADEAAALMLGRDPRVVAERQTASHSSRFKEELNKCRDLIERAQKVGVLRETMTPTELLNWAEARTHPFPAELKSAIQDGPAYHQASQDVNTLGAQVATLTKENERLAADLRSEKLREDSRESLLKLIIGMAIGAYGYEPEADYNKTLGDLKHDLSQVGLSLDDKTIRKYLDKAYRVLDPKVKEDLKAGR